MDKPILYSFRRCPYAMRARLAFVLSNRSCEIREVFLKDKPRSMIKASPKGTVPVLIKKNGEVIDESIEIINLLNLEENIFIFNDHYDFIESTIALFDGKFKFHLDRYKYSSRFISKDKEFHRQECLNILINLENTIESNPWFFGETISKLDICILPFIRQFRIADENWFDENQKIPFVRKTLKYFLNSDLLKVTMQKYRQWKEGDIRVYFP
tara:strand:+ start:970 stop:1605 length:636 start_codon:yes stop_codon:yes gene_type:complete